MESLVLAFVFAAIVGYGVVSVAAPRRSLRLDGTYSGDDGTEGGDTDEGGNEPDATAIRNRRYGGGIAVVVGTVAASVVAGVPGVAICVVVAALARVWVNAS